MKENLEDLIDTNKVNKGKDEKVCPTQEEKEKVSTTF